MQWLKKPPFIQFCYLRTANFTVAGRKIGVGATFRIALKNFQARVLINVIGEVAKHWGSCHRKCMYNLMQFSYLNKADTRNLLEDDLAVGYID